MPSSIIDTTKINKQGVQQLSFKKDLINAAKFTAFLVAGVFALLIALQLADNIDIPVPTSFVPALSYVYIVSYTLLAGLLVYYGVHNYNNILDHFTSSSKLRDLTSVSTIVAFALIFSMSVSYTHLTLPTKA